MLETIITTFRINIEFSYFLYHFLPDDITSHIDNWLGWPTNASLPCPFYIPLDPTGTTLFLTSFYSFDESKNHGVLKYVRDNY